MPVLEPPPSSAPVLFRSPETARRPVVGLDLPNISFFGRTLAEYARFFALDLDSLKGRDVLDVAAGPSSFTAEACVRRINAVAVDPFYGSPADDLAAQIGADYSRMFGQIRAKPRLVRVRRGATVASRSQDRRTGRRQVPDGHVFFESIDAAEADRRLAAQRFLADYETYFPHGRYVGGALPLLPFFDRTFDRVLCAHLLFTYAARFDFDWHLAACRELVRVSDDEARIHPVCGTDGKPYPQISALRRELRAVGIDSEIVPVDYEFFIGADSMLVLRRSGS